MILSFISSVAGVDEKMVSYYQGLDIRNNDKLKKSITIKNLLTMQGGFDWDEFSSYFTGKPSPIKAMNRTFNHVKFALNAPMLTTPGSKFAYNTGGVVILLDILKKSTGMPPDKFAEKNLFKPLGISSYTWIKDRLIFGTPRELFLRPRDMAKLGQLILNKGEWKGRRIISEKWLQEMLTPHVAYVHDGVVKAGYGYLWWLYPDGAESAGIYAGQGKGGQLLFVIPEHNIVVVTTAQEFGSDDIKGRAQAANIVYNYVLKSVTDKD